MLRFAFGDLLVQETHADVVALSELLPCSEQFKEETAGCTGWA